MHLGIDREEQEYAEFSSPRQKNSDSVKAGLKILFKDFIGWAIRTFLHVKHYRELKNGEIWIYYRYTAFIFGMIFYFPQK